MDEHQGVVAGPVFVEGGSQSLDARFAVWKYFYFLQDDMSIGVRIASENPKLRRRLQLSDGMAAWNRYFASPKPKIITLVRELATRRRQLLTDAVPRIQICQ